MKKYPSSFEKTCIIVKPDGVMRGLTGEIIHRFEQAGLKLIGCKMLRPTKKQVLGHYPGTEEWLRGMGEKTLKNYLDYNVDPMKELGTNDPLEIGKKIQGWLVKYWITGPIVVMAYEGNHAIENARMIAGYTLPSGAQPGTIRGDYSLDSAVLANLRKRPVKNIIHASGNTSESKHEISFWFTPSELMEYDRADWAVMFD